MVDEEQLQFTWEDRTIQSRFEEFDRNHPEVYRYLVELAFSAYNIGHRHYGIRTLWERMRWHFYVERDEREEYKLNDHYTSRYVRKIIAEYPELEEFFEIRTLRAS
jgi:hypothetical protein